MSWTQAVHLQNERLDAVILPEAGRIAQLLVQGQIPLLQLKEAVPGPEAEQNKWRELGGEWLWPMAQPHWSKITGADWPPPRVLDDRLWECNSWRTADGSQCCLLKREYDAPLDIKVSRLIRLDGRAARISIRQQIERKKESKIPVTLWNVVRLDHAERILFPTEEISNFPGGYKVMSARAPKPNELKRVGNVMVYDSRGGKELKIGADSKADWIAAQKSNQVVVVKMHTEERGSAPDGNCRQEFFSNPEANYAELETLSPEVRLAPGQTTENLLTIECVDLNSSEASIGAIIQAIKDLP